MKHTERDSIAVEKLVFCMIFVENLIFSSNSSNSSKISKNEQFFFENHWSVQLYSEKIGTFQ